MIKPTVVIVRSRQEWSFSYDTWWADLRSRYFDFELYQEGKTYSPNTTFLITGSLYSSPEILQKFKDKKVIVDLLYEAKYSKWGEVYNVKSPHHIMLYGNYSKVKLPDVIFSPNFFWFGTSLDNIARGYDKYVPNRNYSKKFLMPIGGKREWRDRVVEILEPLLDDAYWSYFRRNKILPGEQIQKRYDMRFQNSMWYDDTCFTLALESINTKHITQESPIFVTEKIFKIFGGQHPYMVVAAAGTLEFLTAQGFETYGNLFNEQYDVETDFGQKMNIIVNNIKNYNKAPHDNITLQKIKHNFHRFYDMTVVTKGFEKEIVRPMYEYIEKAQ